MRWKWVVVLSAMGLVGSSAAWAPADAASSAGARVTPSAYGYIAGTTGSVRASVKDGPNFLSAAAQSFDSGASVPGSGRFAVEGLPLSWS